MHQYSPCPRSHLPLCFSCITFQVHFDVGVPPAKYIPEAAIESSPVTLVRGGGRSPKKGGGGTDEDVDLKRTKEACEDELDSSTCIITSSSYLSTASSRPTPLSFVTESGKKRVRRSTRKVAEASSSPANAFGTGNAKCSISNHPYVLFRALKNLILCY